MTALHIHARVRIVAAACAGLCFALVAAPAASSVKLQAQVEMPYSGNSPATSRTRPAPVKIAQAPRSESKPGWAELTRPQQQALAPLTGTWSTLSEAHKRKWIALSENYPTMPPPEQSRLHSRMAEWAALSPQQRTQARLNFAESQKVPVDDKKAKWEAYQALSPEEKRKLAAGANAAKPPAPPTAAAVQPVPPKKLANVPKPVKPDNRTPRIAGAPNQVDHNPLLPHPGTLLDQP
jgi:hypothetical protein